MVLFDRPIPLVAPEMTPLELATSLRTTPRFAFFKDSRGVVFCEQVDHAQVVLGCLGRASGGNGQPMLYRNVVEWSGDETKFNSEIRELYDRGFIIEPHSAYMVPNAWGVREVIKEVIDLPSGKKLRKICRNGTPEGFYDGQPDQILEAADRKPHNRYHYPIQPFTTMLLDHLEGLSRTREDYADMFDRVDLTLDERTWLDRWIKFG